MTKRLQSLVAAIAFAASFIAAPQLALTWVLRHPQALEGGNRSRRAAASDQNPQWFGQSAPPMLYFRRPA